MPDAIIDGRGNAYPMGVNSDGSINSKLLDGESGNNISVQYPLSTDGDSVYVKDIWLSESTSTNFSGSITDLFNDLHTQMINTTSDNPKTLFIHFNRTIVSNVVGLGSALSGNFSNVKIEIINSGSVATTVIDESAINTKYTSRTFQLPVTAGFNAMRITFHTADTVTLSNCVALKSRSVVSRGQAVKPDGTVIDLNATTGGNQKFSLEEYDETFLGNPLPVQTLPLLVSQGLVTGYTVMQKFGQNDNLNTATYEDIWDGGGTYSYPADATAPITKLVAHDALDTEPIEVQGLDVNGDLVTQTKTLTGLTAVTLDTPLWRVFRLKNIGTSDLLNDVCAINDGDTVDYACINNGNNQTLMALYTIPNGKTGYLYQGTNNLSDVTRGVSASGRLWMRQYGSVFQVKKTFGVSSDGTGFINVKNIFPAKIPAKTDIRVDAIASANGVTLNTTFEILLIDD